MLFVVPIRPQLGHAVTGNYVFVDLVPNLRREFFELEIASIVSFIALRDMIRRVINTIGL